MTTNYNMDVQKNFNDREALTTYLSSLGLILDEDYVFSTAEFVGDCFKFTRPDIENQMLGFSTPDGWELTHPTIKNIESGIIVRSKRNYIAGTLFQDRSGGYEIYHHYRRDSMNKRVGGRRVEVPKEVLETLLKEQRIELREVLGWWAGGLVGEDGKLAKLIELRDKEAVLKVGVCGPGATRNFKGDLVVRNGQYYAVKPLQSGDFEATRVTQEAVDDLAREVAVPINSLLGMGVLAHARGDENSLSIARDVTLIQDQYVPGSKIKA